MTRIEARNLSPIERKEPACPVCRHGLVPVWTLPKKKIKHLQPVEIRQQFYCAPCDRRFALEELDFFGKDTPTE